MFVECGGKMHLREGEYEKAHTDFFEAFKNYDESGSPRYIFMILICVPLISVENFCRKLSITDSGY